MKKIIALCLILVLCLSLCACSLSSTEGFIGSWETEDSGYYKYSLVVRKDHTGVMTLGGASEEFTWVFDEPTRTLVLTSEEGVVQQLVYLEVNDTMVSAGIRFLRVEDAE